MVIIAAGLALLVGAFWCLLKVATLAEDAWRPMEWPTFLQFMPDVPNGVPALAGFSMVIIIMLVTIIAKLTWDIPGYRQQMRSNLVQISMLRGEKGVLKEKLKTAFEGSVQKTRKLRAGDVSDVIGTFMNFIADQALRIKECPSDELDALARRIRKENAGLLHHLSNTYGNIPACRNFEDSERQQALERAGAYSRHCTAHEISELTALVNDGMLRYWKDAAVEAGLDKHQFGGEEIFGKDYTVPRAPANWTMFTGGSLIT
ncbi:MAG: hypothetical protein HOE53_04350 [Candidatus Magasanikbacteria bacterium]|nr:hypothetical protein [Candidatus Magasanikbacteria bacterium]